MKVWTGLAALGLLTVAAWMMPPSATVRRAAALMEPEEELARDLRREVRRSHDILQRTRWADSLTSLALATAVDGVAIGGAPGSLQAGTLDSVRVRIQDEMAMARLEQPRAVVGFFVQPRDHAGLDGVPRDSRSASEIYMGDSDGTAFCLRVLVTRASVSPHNGEIRRYYWTEDESFSNILGACRVVAQYGLPGPSVRRWLERGALGFADEPAYSPARPAGWLGTPRNWPFGRSVPSWTRDLEMDRCLAGMPDACETVMLDPLARQGEVEADVLHVIEQSPVSGIGRVVFRSPFGSADDYLLGDVAAEFGAERFEAFWPSDEDVPEAFEAAFGISLGEWVVSWSDTHFARTAAGPAVSNAAASGTILLMTLCALFAGAWARRRRVA
jgi:hypothetical protein